MLAVSAGFSTLSDALLRYIMTRILGKREWCPLACAQVELGLKVGNDELLETASRAVALCSGSVRVPPSRALRLALLIGGVFAVPSCACIRH